MRSTHNLKKTSLWFCRLLSKSADLSKTWGFFSNFVCFSESPNFISLMWINQMKICKSHLCALDKFTLKLFFFSLLKDPSLIRFNKYNTFGGIVGQNILTHQRRNFITELMTKHKKRDLWPSPTTFRTKTYRIGIWGLTNFHYF